MKNCTKFILLGLLSIHLYLLTNLRFTPWPEMISFPYLFSNGFVLYKDFVIAYPPFLVLFLSFFYKLLGFKVIVLKIVTWALILLSDLFIYKLTKAITKKENYSLLALAFFVFVQPFLDGNMLWFDTFLTVPILVAVYFLLQKKVASKTIVFSGLFLATALFSKQTAFVYLLVAGIFVYLKTRKLGDVLLLLIPSFVLGLVFLLYLISTGSFSDFVNWNFVYPIVYWSNYPSYLQFDLKKVDYLILFGLLFPFLSMFLIKFKRLVSDKSVLLVALMFVASLVAVYPRFSYYHLSVGIALSAICFGIFIKYFQKYNPARLGILVFVILFFWYQQRVVLSWDWSKEDRFYKDADLVVAADIEGRFKRNQSVYLANIHSGVYVYSQTLPPKPWYDNYGWYLEIPGQQEKVIEAWSNNPPEGIYRKDEDVGEWFLPGVYKPGKIYSWVEQNYIQEEQIVDKIWFWNKK